MLEPSEETCELQYRQTRVYKRTHDIAMLKCYQFGRYIEQFISTQASLLNEMIEGDTVGNAAIEDKLIRPCSYYRPMTFRGKPKGAWLQSAAGLNRPGF